METLSQLIRSKKSPDVGIRFIEGADKEFFFTYEQVCKKSLHYLGFLQSRGLKQGDELVFQLDDNQTFVFAFWGCIMGGIIPVPISVGVSDEQKRKLFNVWKYLKNPHLLTGESIFKNTQKYAQTNGMDTKLQAVDSRKIIAEEYDVEENYEGQIADVKATDIALIQFSSGSTGDPKGVVLTHENLLANVEAIQIGSKLTEKDHIFSWMPLTHDMGLIGTHLTPFFVNCHGYCMSTKVFVRRATLWLEKVTEHKATVLCSPNFGYKHFLNAFEKKPDLKLELSNVRVIYNGAEPISIDLCNEFLDRMEQFGMKRTAMFPVYGLAEASLAVAFSLCEEEPMSVTIDRNYLATGEEVREPISNESAISFVDEGYPIKYISLQIADENNNPLPENTIGSVCIKGKNVTKGYYQNPEANKKAFTPDGWLNTGDLGFMRNGRLIITGRAKEIIFVNGQNFYPHDLEKVAQAISGVELGKIAITGFTNEKTLMEEVVAFVLFKNKPEKFVPFAQGIKREILSKTGVVVTHVLPIKSIPKTTSGKIQRVTLAKQFNAGEFDVLASEINKLVHEAQQKRIIEEPTSEIESILMKFCCDTLKTDHIGVNDNFIEHGGSSLMLTQIHEKVDAMYPGKLQISDFFSYPTIAQLSKLIKERGCVEISGVKFDEANFSSIEEDSKIIEFSISGETYQNIVEIAQHEKVRPFDVYTSAYMLLLKELTENSQITLQVLPDFSQKIVSMKIDFDVVQEDLGGFFRLINNRYKNKEQELYYLIWDLNQVKPLRCENCIIPFFYDQRFISNPVSLSSVFDLLIEIIETEEETNFYIQKANLKMKNEFVKDMFTHYLGFIDLIISEYNNILKKQTIQ